MPPIVSDEYKEKKRQEILQSALVCFAKKGFEASTVDDIVSHSGMSKGAIYNYFKSKDEIYLALMERQTSDSRTKFKKEIAARNTALAKLDFLIEAYMDNDPDEEDNKDLALVHFEFRLYSSRKTELKKTLTERYRDFFVDLIAGIIREGQKTGELNATIDPFVYADIFWAMINGVTLQATILDDYQYKKTLKEMLTIFIANIKA